MSDDLPRTLVARLAVVLVVVLAGLLLLAGCGAPNAGYGLERDAASLQSLANEGLLVATSAGAADATNAYLTAHAEELGRSAEQLGAQAASAPAPAGKREVARELSSLASRTAAELRRLAAAPGDRALASRVARALRAIAHRAAALQEQA